MDERGGGSSGAQGRRDDAEESEAVNDGGILSGDVGRSNADDEFSMARALYHSALKRCFNENKDCHGKMFRPKPVADNPHANKVPMSFSMTLIDFAGGMPELREWWEAE